MSKQPGSDLSVDGPIKNRCKAHRKNGDRCGRAPIKGGTVCSTHGGSAPQTVAAARRRLLAAADPLMSNLLKIATSSDDEALRLRATMDALTRAGLTERTTVAVEVTHSFDEVFSGIIDDSVATRRARGQDLVLEAAPTPGGQDDDAVEDARVAAELAAVGEMAAAMSEDEQGRIAAGSGATVGPYGTGAGPSADGTYTVTRMAPRPGEDLPSYLRDPDERGRVDYTR